MILKMLDLFFSCRNLFNNTEEKIGISQKFSLSSILVQKKNFILNFKYASEKSPNIISIKVNDYQIKRVLFLNHYFI